VRAVSINSFHHPIDLFVIDGQLELYFGQKINDVFRPPIELSVALLAPKAFDLCHGNALNPHFCEGGTHIVKLEGLMMAMTIFMQRGSRSVGTGSLAAEFKRELLRHSMTYGNLLMYKRQASCVGRVYIKKRRGPLKEPAPPGYRTDGGVGWLAGARCS